MKPSVLIRADSSSQIGTGHIMRCLVLADMLRDGGFEVRFLTRLLPGHIKDRIQEEGFSAIPVMSTQRESEITEVSEMLLRQKTAVVVFDHYQIDAGYEEAVKSRTGVKIVALDDTYNRHYSDILINPNIYAEKERYAGLLPDDCMVLCGLAYALVRKEFRDGCSKLVNKSPLNEMNLLLTLGGADPGNETSRIIRGLSSFDACSITANVVVGPANAHIDAISECASEVAYRVNIIVDARNMAELMCKSDCIITSSGGTFIEALFTRVPVIVVNIASNQDVGYEYARENNIAYVLDKSLLNMSLQYALQAVAGRTDLHLRIAANHNKMLEFYHRIDLLRLLKAAVV